MIFRQTIPYLSKRITLPQLSPTHSKARIVRFEVANGDSVTDYDPFMTIECSADMVTEAFRDFPDQQAVMLIDTQEVGIIKGVKHSLINQWIPVGTELGSIDDGDPIDGDW
eukprot:CAMPEP_0178924864 /NCGR_PEP_ID=MMETSP0786-20121207/17566_1 /TAXON_ID=186022 /ORGANISM="Thalassionema frauenfeldii, Strain CCMP 1798" /LENGTH=110 /DNA_ID=CAMNT_0020599627 /DNA_START=41 /DNA_END=370 /DNA_ORIENTATION=+